MKKTILSLMFLLASLMMMAQAEVYIDPSASDDGDGSIENPFNYTPVVQSNTTYFLKSGGVLTQPEMKISNKHNVKITTYGGDKRFKFNANGGDKAKFFGTSGSSIVIENIEINGNGELCPYLSMYSPGKPYADVRCDYVTISNCKFYNFVSGIRAFGATNLTVKGCEIFNIGEDGAFITGCDNVNFINNHIYKVNQGFFSEAAGTTAAGDGIQLEPVKNWKVIGNVIDRSDTGNKFAFIANNRDSAGIKICRDNTFIGPFEGGHGGAIMYITGAADSVDISGNLFIMSNPNKPVSGLYQKVYNANIHDNLFVNCGSSLIMNNARFVNNEACGVDMQLSAYHNDWTGEKPKYIGKCPNILIPPEDTTTQPPVQDTVSQPPVQDTTVVTPPVEDSVIVVNPPVDTVQKSDTVKYTIDIIQGYYHVMDAGKEVDSKSVNQANAFQKLLNYTFEHPDRADSVFIQQDPIKIKIQYK
jgi:hypothetical protein